MSFYRSVIAAVAAMGLATCVFAAEETTTQTTTTQTTEATQVSEQAATESKVDVNKASAKDLMKVKGLTAAKAKAIVSYRKKHGDFKSLDDLKQVKGFKKMNEETFKNIEEQLTVG